MISVGRPWILFLANHRMAFGPVVLGLLLDEWLGPWIAVARVSIIHQLAFASGGLLPNQKFKKQI